MVDPTRGTIFDRVDPPKDFWKIRRRMTYIAGITAVLFPFYPILFSWAFESMERFNKWIDYLDSISTSYLFLAGSLIVAYVSWVSLHDKWSR